MSKLLPVWVKEILRWIKTLTWPTTMHMNYQRKEARVSKSTSFMNTWQQSCQKKNHNKLSAINIATPAFYHYSSLARGKGERIYVTCLHRVHTGHPEFSLTFSNKPCNFIILITGIVYPSFTCSWLKLYMSGSLKNWALPEWQWLKQHTEVHTFQWNQRLANHCSANVGLQHLR